jgi:hypothetical protein
MAALVTLQGAHAPRSALRPASPTADEDMLPADDPITRITTDTSASPELLHCFAAAGHLWCKRSVH